MQWCTNEHKCKTSCKAFNALESTLLTVPLQLSLIVISRQSCTERFTALTTRKYPLGSGTDAAILLPRPQGRLCVSIIGPLHRWPGRMVPGQPRCCRTSMRLMTSGGPRERMTTLSPTGGRSSMATSSISADPYVSCAIKRKSSGLILASILSMGKYRRFWRLGSGGRLSTRRNLARSLLSSLSNELANLATLD